MVTAPEFQVAGLIVRLAISPPFRHAVPFVQLVEQHKPPFILLNRIVDPNLTVRDEFVNVVMPPGGEVNIECASHQPSIHNPYAYTILQFLP